MFIDDDKGFLRWYEQNENAFLFCCILLYVVRDFFLVSHNGIVLI